MRYGLGYTKMAIGWVRGRSRHGVYLLGAARARVAFHLAFRTELAELARTQRQTAATARSMPSVAASAGWFFPTYSHTFVYQELTQLLQAGCQLYFFYGATNARDALAPQFWPLMRAKRRLFVHPAVCRQSIKHFRRRMPERVDRLMADLAAHSGLSREALLAHEHVGQAFAYARLVEALSPEYLHSYFFYQDTLYALVASTLLEIPRGVSCYADHMLDDYPLKVVPLHLRQCQVVVATSRRIADELRQIAPDLPPERIVVKPNAINADHFPAVVRPTRGPADPFVIVTLCRLEAKKGLTHLADAVRQLRDQGLPVEWVLLGGVDPNEASRAYASNLEQRISALGIGEVVHMPGRQSEAQINAAFAQADVFVAPFVETETGDKDGIPTALLEGMASGLPVVATDAGSIPEVIEDGRTGLLVPQRDAAALAAAIATLAASPERRRAMGREGAAVVRATFDVRVCEGVLHERLRPFRTAPTEAPSRPTRLQGFRRAIDAIRAADWWSYKIPPLLLTAYAGYVAVALPTVAWRPVALTVASILLIAIYGYVQNDVCDVEADRQAGKPNRMTTVGPMGRLLWPAAPAAGALALIWGTGDWMLRALAVLNLIVPMLYSVRPVRLKQRGVWGALADATGVHILPMASVARAVTLYAPPSPWVDVFVASAIAWAALAGLRGIIVHQVVDREADEAAGVRTFGGALGAVRARAIVMRVLLPLEIVALTVFLAPLLWHAWVVIVALVLWAAAETVKVRRGWTLPLLDPSGRTTESYVPVVNNELYEMWLPVAFAVQLALRDWPLWLLVAVHVYLFLPNMRTRLNIAITVMEPSS